MENDGQELDSPETSDDLLQFMLDNPDADAPVAENTLNAAPSDADETEEEDNEDAPDEAETQVKAEEAKDQTSGLKFKVPVKGEDGADTTVEVDQKELIAGYQRHQDYTRKTMALADQEREVVQAVSSKLATGQAQLAEQLQLAQAAIQHFAGLKTPDEMARLAQSDPAAWVAEQQRAQGVQSVLSQFQGMTQQQKADAEAQRQATYQTQYTETWKALAKEGIDKPKLKGIFETIISKYGETPERLSTINDPTLVRIMRDAAAYQDLLSKKSSVTEKIAKAPKLPVQRQSVPQNEQRTRALDGRFKSGRASLKDLAAFLAE